MVFRIGGDPIRKVKMVAKRHENRSTSRQAQPPTQQQQQPQQQPQQQRESLKPLKPSKRNTTVTLADDFSSSCALHGNTRRSLDAGSFEHDCDTQQKQPSRKSGRRARQEQLQDGACHWNSDEDDDAGSSAAPSITPLPQARLVLEVCQISALLVILGAGAAHSSFALIATLIEGDTGSMQIRDFRLPAMVATFFQTTSGVAAMITGMYAMFAFVQIMLCMNAFKGASTAVAINSSPSDRSPSIRNEDPCGGQGITSRQTRQTRHDQLRQRLLLQQCHRIWRRFHMWCKILVALINLSPISFIITITRLLQGASEPPEQNDFIPMLLNPTEDDVHCVVFMGLLVLISVCGTLIGGLTVLSLHLCAILGYQAHSRHVGYHALRYAYYSLLVAAGGISQVLLGVFAWHRFGFGPYKQAIHVATYTVYFPLVSIIVGCAQCIMAYVGWRRARRVIRGDCPDALLSVNTSTRDINEVGASFDCERENANDSGVEQHTSSATSKQQPQLQQPQLQHQNLQRHTSNATQRLPFHATAAASYDYTMWYVVLTTFVITVYLQFLFQPSYGTQETAGTHGGDFTRCYSAEGATIASVYLGFFCMPLYLDHLVQTTPWSIRSDEMYDRDSMPYKEDLLVKCCGLEPRVRQAREHVPYSAAASADGFQCNQDTRAAAIRHRHASDPTQDVDQSHDFCK